MRVFQYDGSLSGFLTALDEALHGAMPPDEISACGVEQPGLSAAPIFLETQFERIRHVAGALKAKTGWEAMRNVFHAFLSDAPGREMAIYRYCAFGLEVGARLDSFLADDRVIRVHRLAESVKKEAHRYLGLARFEELADGTLYARIEPDHDILPLIANHFQKRLPRQAWVIHDLKSGKAAVAANGCVTLAEITVDGQPVLSDTEMEIREAWKRYFIHMGIEERRNPRLQRQHIPLRYWKHLIEMQSGRRAKS